MTNNAMPTNAMRTKPVFLVCLPSDKKLWLRVLSQTALNPPVEYAARLDNLPAINVCEPSCLVVSCPTVHLIKEVVEKAKVAYPDIAIIVDLPLEEPATAFEFIKLGVAYADSNIKRSPGNLNRILGNPTTKLVSRIGIQQLLPTPISQPTFFMSMSFDANCMTDLIYRKVLEPTFERLKISISREDESFLANDEILTKTRKAIDCADAVIMDLNNPTLNTMFEVGYATAKEKRIIYFRTERGEMPKCCVKCGVTPAGAVVPALLRNIQYIRYETSIQLAMHLYFGLGGTLDALRS